MLVLAPAKVFSRTLHRPERHLRHRTPRSPFPREEQPRIRVGDVILTLERNHLRRLIDPSRTSLDLSEISNRRLIDHDMTLAVAPLRAILLVQNVGTNPSPRKIASIFLPSATLVSVSTRTL